jgi:hypothetical protein
MPKGHKLYLVVIRVMIMVGAMIESMSTENSHPKIAVLLFHFFIVMSVRKA